MNDPDLPPTAAEAAPLRPARAATRCAVTGCPRPAKARGWCDTHYTRWRRTGHPRGDTPIRTRAQNPDSYHAVRDRLRRLRGPASALPCVECGTAAREWSYDYSDPHERTDPARGTRYSTNPDCYVPRCRSCHRRATRRGGRPLDATHCAQLYHDGHTLTAIARATGHSTAEIRRTLLTTATPIRHTRKRKRRTHPHHQITPPTSNP